MQLLTHEVGGPSHLYRHEFRGFLSCDPHLPLHLRGIHTSRSSGLGTTVPIPLPALPALEICCDTIKNLTLSLKATWSVRARNFAPLQVAACIGTPSAAQPPLRIRAYHMRGAATVMPYCFKQPAARTLISQQGANSACRPHGQEHTVRQQKHNSNIDPQRAMRT